MSNKSLIKYINGKNYSVSPWFLRVLRKSNVTIDELILLIYFNNLSEKTLNLEEINNDLGYSNEEILSIFSSLNNKKLIKIVNKKDENGKIREFISLEQIDNLIMDSVGELETKNNSKSIFETFEKEFGRTLSPMEYEIINAWLEKSINEELIIGALKEATYNNVRSLRYIDKIIYEWGKKGFKNMEDVKNHLVKRNVDLDKTLFDYNWLDEEDK
ncbi:MAG TPA: DnaD domain protein [Bacilli bacterium]|nr:DnaD domain protein [Bacilli bacterium]